MTDLVKRLRTICATVNVSGNEDLYWLGDEAADEIELLRESKVRLRKWLSETQNAYDELDQELTREKRRLMGRITALENNQLQNTNLDKAEPEQQDTKSETAAHIGDD